MGRIILSNKNTIIGYKELISLAQNDYDLVAMVITQYHLINLKAFIRYRFNGQNVKVLLLIGKHTRSGFMINIDNDYFDQSIACDIYYYDPKVSDNLQRLERDVSSTKSLIYIVQPERPWASLSLMLKKIKTKIISVVIDDGIGSYNGLLSWTRTTIEDTGSVAQGIHYFMSRVGGSVLLKWNGISIEYFSFFRPNTFASETVAECLKKEFEESAKNIGRFKFEPNSIIYLSQAFTDQTLYSTSCEMAKKILRSFSNNGFIVYVKLHPREVNDGVWEKEPFQILHDYSIETIIASSNTKPRYVIGFTSTSLITLSVIWKINCISLSKLYLNDYQNEIISNFLGIINKMQKKLPRLILPEDVNSIIER